MKKTSTINPSLIVFKDNNLNKASFHNFRLNHYQVFLNLVSQIRAYEQFAKEYDISNKKFLLKAKDFAQIFSTDIKSCYRILKNSTKKLMNTQIQVPKNHLNATYEINICAAALYVPKQGEIEVEFTKQIIPYLVNVKNKFTQYNLKNIAHFKSIYSTRLYELIMEYKSTGWINVSVLELRRIFGTEQKFKLFGDFKRKTFAYACAEINKIHSLSLRFTEVKKGRKVVKIRFDFTPQNAENLQEAQISSLKEEVFVSDDKLVQAKFLDISPNTEQKSVKQVETAKIVKKSTTKIETSFTKNNRPKNKNEIAKPSQKKKSLWRRIKSYLF